MTRPPTPRGEAPRALDAYVSENIRRDAVTCALAGIAAVDPGDLVRRALAQHAIDGNDRNVAVNCMLSECASHQIAGINSRDSGERASYGIPAYVLAHVRVKRSRRFSSRRRRPCHTLPDSPHLAREFP